MIKAIFEFLNKLLSLFTKTPYEKAEARKKKILAQINKEHEDGL